MYLLDTNIWLEHLLEQERSEEVRLLLDETPSSRLFITDFTFHSIGVILDRLGKHNTFLQFVEDLFIVGAVGVVALEPADMGRLVAVASDYRLDFDDAYQYVAATGQDLILVSLDADFDRTKLGRMGPLDALDKLAAGGHQDEE